VVESEAQAATTHEKTATATTSTATADRRGRGVWLRAYRRHVGDFCKQGKPQFPSRLHG
jgi:hypothetical protein